MSELNSAGAVVGIGTNTGFSQRVFLAFAPTAVPEPSRMILFGPEAAGPVWYGWRCRKRKS